MFFASFLIIILGLVLGSFANCVVWRLYRQETIMGRSYCPLCHKKIWWYDNIPLLSYIILRGRCRFCRKLISWQYPVVEALVAILFFFFWFKHLGFIWRDFDFLMTAIGSLSFWLPLWRDLLAVWAFTVIFIFDLRFYLVSNLIVWPFALCFIIINLLLGASWLALLITMASAALFFGLQFILTRGRGLGEGDIWLGLLLGALFPDGERLVLAILSAYLLGTIVGVGLILLGRKNWGSKIPLGVFLALGALLALAYGSELLSIYWQLL